MADRDPLVHLSYLGMGRLFLCLSFSLNGRRPLFLVVRAIQTSFVLASVSLFVCRLADTFV